MITKIATASMGNPRKIYVLPSEYAGEGGKITNKQMETLSRLVRERVEHEGERERWLASLGDMDARDASDAIFELLISG